VFLPNLRERPPALPLLGVRAARRAVAVHPDDAGAWLVLARAYLALARTTTEATDHATLLPLAEIRRIQTVTALVQAINCRPDLALAHETLALLYAERQFFDLALAHRRTQLRLVRQAGRSAGEDPTAYAARIERLEEAVEEMERIVFASENRFLVRSQTLAGNPLARARLALRLGLAGKALDDVLLRSHADLYGVEGLRLLLELLLHTGRAQDARDLLDRPEMRRNPDGLGIYDLAATSPAPARAGAARAGETRAGRSPRRWSYRFPAHDWFDLCQAAAAGHYDRASRALERMRSRMTDQGARISARFVPVLARCLTAEVGLGATPAALPLRLANRLQRDPVAGLLVQNQFQLVVRADLHVLEGMLLLERGQPERAGGHFRRSLKLYPQAAETAPALPGQPLAHCYLEWISARALCAGR
jgi:tetratricopeptide (TPR) repeat protein